MAPSKKGLCDFGWKARAFKLKGVDGKSYTPADVRGPKGTLVVFICNHCPYVKASIDRIVAEAKAIREIGVGTIAIMPNDTATYREDSFDNMKAFALKHGFTFPYVIDETQEVARAYDAQCTPDFFGFNTQDELQYRGRLDAARMTPVITWIVSSSRPQYNRHVFIVILFTEHAFDRLFVDSIRTH